MSGENTVIEFVSVRKSGESLILRLPPRIRQAMGLKAHDYVAMQTDGISLSVNKISLRDAIIRANPNGRPEAK